MARAAPAGLPPGALAWRPAVLDYVRGIVSQLLDRARSLHDTALAEQRVAGEVNHGAVVDPGPSRQLVGQCPFWIIQGPAQLGQVAAQQCADANLQPSADNLKRIRRAILCLHNKVRAQNGLSPLRENRRLRYQVQRNLSSEIVTRSLPMTSDVHRTESSAVILAANVARDDADGIRRANGDAVNLTASVWSRDNKRAERVGSELRAGVVTLNNHGVMAGAAWVPWGGVGESGFGRLNGEEGIREFTVPTHIAKPTMGQLKQPFWYPYDEASETAIRGLNKVLGWPELGERI